MPNKPDHSTWDQIAAKGFYYHTDPQKPGAGESNLVEEPEEAIKKRQEAGMIDKMVSAAFDTPVSISAKAGDALGKKAQWLSEKAEQGINYLGQVPGINKIDDGIKAIDKSGALKALSQGQLPGGEAFENFLSDGISRIERIKEAPWIGKMMALPATAVAESMKIIMPDSWDKIVNGITLEFTNDLLTEMAQILVDWYQDPKTLCCLIKNLSALGSMLREQDFSSENWDEEKQKFFKGINVDDYLGTDYFKAKKILINIREYLDIAIEVLSVDFTRELFATFDIGKEISDMLIGILIAVMEAMIASGKKAWYDKVQEWFKDLDQINIQCLPFQKLIDALFRFFSDDHGLFNLLRRYIEEYARYLKWRFIKNFREKYISKTRDLQFLKFVRDLIGKIIESLENIEICVEADYSINAIENPLSDFGSQADLCPYGISAKVTNDWADCPYRTLTNNDIVCRVNEKVTITNGRTSYCIHPDAIADYFDTQRYGDQGNLGKISGELPGSSSKLGDKEEIAITFPTDNEVRNFLINKLGYSQDQADQMIAESQSSSKEGKIEVGSSLSDLTGGNTSSTTTDGRVLNRNEDLIDKRKELMSALGDCAKTLSAGAVADLANRLKDIL